MIKTCSHGIIGISKCKDCTRARKRRYMQKGEPAAKSRIRSRKRLGCINPTGETKHGPCELCGRIRRLYYDHNHWTGAFRGWLCNDCNTKLDWAIEHEQEIKIYLAKRGINET